MKKGHLRVRRLMLAAIFLWASLLFFSDAAWSQRIQRWTCSLPHSGEIRYLDLSYATAGPVPCTGSYRKPTESRTIADYQRTPGQCERHISNLLATLERGGYVCSGPSSIQGHFAVEKPATTRPGRLVSDAVRSPSAQLTEENAFFAVVSSHVDAQAAHRALAELRRRHPYLRAKVFPPRTNADYWGVLMAAYTTKSEAERAVEIAKRERLGHDPFLWTFPRPLTDTYGNWIAVPDDWQRHAIRSCLDSGASTVGAMASCTGLNVSPDTFILCMAGGNCMPKELRIDQVPANPDRTLPMEVGNYTDLITFVEPMIATQQAAKDCMTDADRTSNDRTDAFARCMARSMMTDEQREITSCYEENGDSTAAFAVCAAGDTLPEEHRQMAQCLIDADTDEQRFSCVQRTYLSEDQRRLVACAKEGETSADIAACMGEEMVPGEYRPYVRCALRHRGSTDEMLGCATANLVPDEYRNVTQCGVASSGDPLQFGLCMANDNLTPEQEIAASCLIATGGEPFSFVSCAGGRLTAAEMMKCVSGGIGTQSGCFGPNNTIVVTLRNILVDLERGGLGENNEIRKAIETVTNDLRNGLGENNDIRRTLQNAANDLKHGPGENNEIRKAVEAFTKIVPSIKW